MKKTGFSLAEVLLTLGLIGVVAAMTLPILLENVNDTKYRSLLKSFYGKFSVNLDEILTNTNDGDGGSICDTFDCFNEITASTFIDPTILNIHKFKQCNGNCPPTNAPTTEFTIGTQKYLANDMTISIIPRNGGCGELNNATVQYKDKNLSVCALLLVDVNGPSGPNNYKKDRFAFFILSGKEVKQYNNKSDIYETLTTRASNLLPVGLVKHDNTYFPYSSYFGSSGDCAGNATDNTQFNCTAEVLDGHGNWKDRNYSWTNEGKPIENCPTGTTCYNK